MSQKSRHSFFALFIISQFFLPIFNICWFQLNNPTRTFPIIPIIKIILIEKSKDMNNRRTGTHSQKIYTIDWKHCVKFTWKKIENKNSPESISYNNWNWTTNNWGKLIKIDTDTDGFFYALKAFFECRHLLLSSPKWVWYQIFHE